VLTMMDISPLLTVLLFRLAFTASRRSRERKGGFMLLKLPRLLRRAPAPSLKLAGLVTPPGPIVTPAPLVRKPLCTECVFAHVVRGFEPAEELILCGYAFPPREILFVVRECTDYRPKRSMTKRESIAEWEMRAGVPRKEKTGFRVVIATSEDKNKEVLVADSPNQGHGSAS
jgi:hypothetical protein